MISGPGKKNWGGGVVENGPSPSTVGGSLFGWWQNVRVEYVDAAHAYRWRLATGGFKTCDWGGFDLGKKN
jgi:hypothetical protein